MILLLATPPNNHGSVEMSTIHFFGKPLASGKLHCDFTYVKASGLI